MRGLTSQPIAKGYVHMCIVFAIVSGLSTACAQLIHMPLYGDSRPLLGLNGCGHVLTQVTRVPIIGRVFERVFDYLAR